MEPTATTADAAASENAALPLVPPTSEWLTCFCVVKFDIEIGQSKW